MKKTTSKKKKIAFTLIILGVILIGMGVYFYFLDSTEAKNVISVLGSLLSGTLVAGKGIKDWIELFQESKKPDVDKGIEVSGAYSQISTGEEARNIQTGGGDYIENLEISLSIQDDAFTQQFVSKRASKKKPKNTTPFLIGVVLDLSKSAFDSVYQLSQQDEDFFASLVKALNTLVHKSISYSKHPHSREVLPKFSLFFYGFGFGNALKGLDSMVKRLGIISDTDNEISTEPIRDLLKLTADDEGFPDTPDAVELNKYWKVYRTGILAQYMDMEFNDAPLVQTLRISHDRIRKELETKEFQPLLLVMTNGRFTDGNYTELFDVTESIKKDGITIVVGFIGKNDIMPNRILFDTENSEWDDEAKALFLCSSELDKNGKIGKAVAEMAIEKSWQVPDKAKLFLQVC
ncbi:MAG: hypothetical protein HN392_02455 [Anaerolineae bacterium]|nr:hypothetical protein [Anaerolineae bacterium]MBT7075029.1 hypothetical protein [Anaerolineae bacterium]